MQWKLPLLVSLTATARAFDPIPYPECTDEQYFDISSLSCTSCPTGQQPDPSGRSCQCTGGKLASSGGVWSCDSCGDGEAPTRDGLACLPCDSLTTDGYNSVTDECACPENLGLVERDGLGGLLPAKMCMDCPSATRPISTTAGVWHCEPCPAEDMEAKQVAGRSDYECRCKSGFQERKHAQGWWGRDTSCLEQTAYDAVKSYDTASADTITYRDLVGESGLPLPLTTSLTLILTLPLTLTLTPTLTLARHEERRVEALRPAAHRERHRLPEGGERGRGPAAAAPGQRGLPGTRQPVRAANVRRGRALVRALP